MSIRKGLGPGVALERPGVVVRGLPETFVIDKNGMIRYIQIGPVTVASLEKEDRADHSCAAGIVSRFAKKVR